MAFDRAQATVEIEERNHLRKEARFPLLSIPHELHRRQQVEERQAFEAFIVANRKLYDRTLRMAVDRYRRRTANPLGWRPGFCVGMGIGSYVNQLFRARWRELAGQFGLDNS